MQDPIAFLSEACRVADHIYLWTHMYDGEKISEGQKVNFLSRFDQTREAFGRPITLHARSYMIGDYSKLPLYWEGAPEDLTYWMSLEDIHFVLNQYGFDVVAEQVAQMEPPGLPCVQLTASRR
jgi:hypothetical protein